MKNLKWHTTTVKLSELVFPHWNPRKISKKEKEKLQESLEKFNLVELPVLNSDNVVIAGNQRGQLLSMAYDSGAIIEVRKPNRKLTLEEVKEYNIRSNKNGGEFDFQMLQDNFKAEDLLSWGFEKSELKFLEPEELPELDSNITVTKRGRPRIIKITFKDDAIYEDVLEDIRNILAAKYPKAAIETSTTKLQEIK